MRPTATLIHYEKLQNLSYTLMSRGNKTSIFSSINKIIIDKSIKSLIQEKHQYVSLSSSTSPDFGKAVWCRPAPVSRLDCGKKVLQGPGHSACRAACLWLCSAAHLRRIRRPCLTCRGRQGITPNTRASHWQLEGSAAVTGSRDFAFSSYLCLNIGWHSANDILL